ncbi:MAG TPA: hypothetical protein VGC80_12660, partial [Acetobacteraceae bacterium]
MTFRFTPEQSDAAARVRAALALRTPATPAGSDRLFIQFAAAVVNQMLVRADAAHRCCEEMLGPPLPPATLVHIDEPDDETDAAAALAFANLWIDESGAGAAGPERAAAAAWFRSRIRVLPAVVALAGQAGWDQQCWQLAARCHEPLVAEGALAEAADTGAVGLAAAERCGDQQGIAVMHLACGAVAKMSGKLHEAMMHYDQAAPLLKQLGDVRG